jgi:hypothetical protein
MPTKVLIHKRFLTGELDTEFAVDLRNMNSAQRAALDVFISNLTMGTYHDGRNKESWTDAHGRSLPAAADFRAANAWHYHSGPTQTKRGSALTPPDLPTNLDGNRTNEAIHYFKNGAGVAIFGFSKNHVPFLNKATAPVGQKHPYCISLATRFQNIEFPGASVTGAPAVVVMKAGTGVYYAGLIKHKHKLVRKTAEDDDEDD